MPPIVYYQLNKFKKMIKSESVEYEGGEAQNDLKEEFKEKWGVLIENLNEKNGWALNFYFIFFLRRFILVTVLIFFDGNRFT